MARSSRSRELAVWANGVRVGTWRLPARGAMELEYDAHWLEAPEARPLSLSLRLMGNMVSDHKVVSIFFGLVPLLVPVPFLILGTLVVVIQTLVFCLLSMVYISMAVTTHEHEDHGHADHGHAGHGDHAHSH